MILRPAAEIYRDCQNDRKLYVCHNYPACNTYVAAHPGTNQPMGVPANGDLRNLRIQAHRKFDRIWQTGIMTRENAYRWFADSFGLSLKDAHIGMCSEYRCKELIRLCDEVLARNHGAVSSSGFGDGGYTCYTHADENGVIDFAFIVFI